jgi:glycosyltransferase involved in cell wall biosynthesis
MADHERVDDGPDATAAVTLTDWAVAALLVAVMASGFDVFFGLRKLARAAALPPWEGPNPPAVSLVVPARNEERNIERAMRSLLAQQWPALEIVAVDDRSDDGTGAILDRLSAQDPRLTVVHVTGLPNGWLGKNHALHLGAARARGTWILFADADVLMHPELVSRIVRYATERGFDHVALGPEMRMPGFFLEAFSTGFVLSFHGFMRPWKARDPKSAHFIGIGAFNLVRAEAYRRAGGHEPIRLRPDDDIKLGKILKRSGARQDLVEGTGMASVEWYHSLRELVRGLEKNAFAGLEYRVMFAVPAVLLHLTMGLGPLVGLVLLRGLPQVLCAVMVAWALFLYGHVAGRIGTRRSTALLYPLFVAMFNWIVLRTMVVNLRDGGIRWRGTFYPLAELRKNRV